MAPCRTLNALGRMRPTGRRLGRRQEAQRGGVSARCWASFVGPTYGLARLAALEEEIAEGRKALERLPGSLGQV